ncbi:hypothetical protein D3C77_713090 [compost metagenome]
MSEHGVKVNQIQEGKSGKRRLQCLDQFIHAVCIGHGAHRFGYSFSVINVGYFAERNDIKAAILQLIHRRTPKRL